MKLTVLIWVCYLAVAGVYLAAGVPKILDLEQFALDIYRYQILPSSLINITAILLPFIEVVAAVTLLLIPRYRDAAAFVLTGLTAVFTLAIVSAMVRGLDISCGCFSTESPITWWKIAENIGLLVIGALSFLGARTAIEGEPTDGGMN